MRRKTKDLDQIQKDLKRPNLLLNQEVDVEQVGGAQHYCIHCA